MADDKIDREERMEEGLQRIADWSEAYPLKVFPEPDEAYSTTGIAAISLAAQLVKLARLQRAIAEGLPHGDCLR